MIRVMAWVICGGLVAAWYALDAKEAKIKASQPPKRGVGDNEPWR